MKIKGHSFLPIFFSTLIVALLANSCDNGVGLLSSIQKETNVGGTSVFRKATTRSIVKAGAKYYAGMGKIFSRAVAGGSWNLVSITGVGTDYRSFCLASTGTEIYASVMKIESDNTETFYGLYASSDGTAWTKIDTTAMMSGTGYNYIDALFAANGRLFAQGHKSSSTVAANNAYGLYYLDGSAMAPMQFAVATDAATPFAGVAYYGSAYFIAVGAKIFSTSSLAAVAADTGAAFGSYSSDVAYVAKAIASGTAGIYVTTSSGKVYFHDGSAWQSGSSVVFTSITDIVELTFGTTTKILIGTDAPDYSSSAAGYFEGTWASGFSTGDSGAIARDTFSTTMAGRGVTHFLWDAAEGRLFAAVAPRASYAEYGLYVSTWNGSSWSGWTAE